MTEAEDNALYKLVYGEDHEEIPGIFRAENGLASLFKMVRFLARRIYELENK